MPKTILSPGIFNFETQTNRPPLSVEQLGAVFIGPTQKGQAFIPIPISSNLDFLNIFGLPDYRLYVPYAVNSYLQNGNVATIIRVLGKGNPNNGNTVDLGRCFDLAFGKNDLINTVASSYTANLSAAESLCILRSRQTASVDIVSDVTYTGNAQSFSATIAGITYGPLSLDYTQKNYIKRILGTDPTRVVNGDSATGVYVDSVLDYRVTTFTGGYTGSAYGSLSNAASGSVSGLRNITGGYKTAATPNIVSQPYVSGTAVTVYDLFQLVGFSDGEAGNQNIKISIVDIETSTVDFKTAPKFTILVRDFNDTDKRPVVFERFRVDLNSQSPYFISKVIGDRFTTTTISAPGATPETVYLPVNSYPNSSRFIYVNLFPGYNFDSRPAGFRGPKSINPFLGTLATGQLALENDIPLQTNHVGSDGIKSAKTYLGFLYEGTSAIGFTDRLKGSFAAVDTTYPSRGFLIQATTSESTFWTPSLTATYNTSLTSQFTLVDVTVTGSTTIVQNAYQFSVPVLGGHDGIPPSKSIDKAINDGTLSAEYLSALGILRNEFNLNFNLLIAPGVHSGASLYNGNFCTAAIDVAETRQDFFYIMDMGQSLDPTANNITTDAMNASTNDAITTALGFDSNRAAIYYPWIRIFDANIENFVFVPPSVEVCGIYAFTDRITQPWYAPAGYNRGTLDRVPELRRNLVRDDLDILYPGRVNPIVMIKGQGPVIFGQKTLQKSPGDLTSINIARMLITVEKTISTIARTSLFEFNDSKQRNDLKNAINSYLARVQAQRGLAVFAITLDETNNTEAVIDQNQMVGTLLLKPTHVSEFIIFNYVLTSSGFILSQK